MATGADTQPPGAFGGVERLPLPSKPDVDVQTVLIQRPIGVSVVACMHFICAAVCGIGVASECYESVIGGASYRTGRQMAGFLAMGLVFFIFGRAFWHIREWVRVVTLTLLFVALIVGGPSSDWWGRAVDVLVILYLMSSSVKEAFREVGKHDQPVIVGRWLAKR